MILHTLDRTIGKIERSLGIESESLITLLFHAVTEDGKKNPDDLLYGQAMSTGDIGECIEHFLAAGYRFIVPRDLVNGLPKEKAVMLTFDDGYANNLLILPVLERYQVPACFFLSTNYIAKQRAFWWDTVYAHRQKEGRSLDAIRTELSIMKKLSVAEREAFIKKEWGDARHPLSEATRPLTIEEVKMMAAHPLVEIGNHTADHALLTRETSEGARMQIRSAQQAIETWTGKKPTCISYPNGYCDHRILRIAVEEGLTSGITTRKGKNVLPLEAHERRMLFLQRFGISGDQDIATQCKTIRQNSLLNRPSGLERAEQLRILITDTQELAGMGTVRSLGRAGHRVTAAHVAGVHPAVRHSRYCTETVSYPDPWTKQSAFQEWIKEQCKSGAYDALFPVTEASIAAVAAIRKELPASLMLLMPSDHDLQFTLSKYHATKAAIDAGVPAPKTVFIHDGHSQTWHTDLSSLQFPIVIKTDNILQGESYKKGTHVIVRSQAEADDVLAECKERGGAVIAQECIPGSGKGVSVLRWKGKMPLTFAYRRLHEVPWTGGASSMRESRHNAALETAARKMLDAVDYEGIAMVEFREPKNGEAAFLEINGRPWGSIALSLHAGIDFPAALVDCMTLQETKRNSRYSDGVVCRNVYPGDLRYLLSILQTKRRPGMQMPSKILSVLEFFLACFNPFIRYDYFWWTDPLPAAFQFLVMADDLRSGLLFRLKKVSRSGDTKRVLTHAKRTTLPAQVRSILFLCHGNIYRSAFAEKMWEAMRATDATLPAAQSAGMLEGGRSTPVRLQPLIESLGANLQAHRSTQITQEMIDHAEIVCIMDMQNRTELLRAFPSAEKKIVFLGSFSGDGDIEIHDPDRLPANRARPVFEKIERSLKGLKQALLSAKN